MKKKPSKRLVHAVRMSIKAWQWQYDNPSETKDRNPFYKKIGHTCHVCVELRGNCNKCFVPRYDRGRECCDHGSIFERWEQAVSTQHYLWFDPKTSKSAARARSKRASAAAIRICRKFLEDNGITE